jgi:hypothetical protein
MLSQKQLQNVCLLFSGNSNQCRYLEEDSKNWQWLCTKHKKSFKDSKDKAIEKFLEDCKANSIDPTTKGVALGDNCGGFPILKFLVQGFDIP